MEIMNTKNLILSLCGLLFLIGCNKKDSTPTQSDTYIQYKINGQVVKIVGDLIPVNQSTDVGVIAGRSTRGIFVNNFYKIIGKQAGFNYITLKIPVDSLEIKSYYLDASTYSASAQANVDVFYKDTLYRLQQVSDFTNISISSYYNGRISGTFFGAMSYYNANTNYGLQVTITDGVFKDVKVIY